MDDGARGRFFSTIVLLARDAHPFVAGFADGAEEAVIARASFRAGHDHAFSGQGVARRNETRRRYDGRAIVGAKLGQRRARLDFTGSTEALLAGIGGFGLCARRGEQGREAYDDGPSD
jgi:hypothetical protein